MKEGITLSKSEIILINYKTKSLDYADKLGMNKKF